jgi:nucleoside-diphosphate-sugar epimerase
MKVLVTGATGYLGTVAAEALAARSHQVLGLPNPIGPPAHCASVASSR